MEKPLKIAAWSGVIGLVVSLFLYLIIFSLGDSPVRYSVSLVGGLIAGLLGIFFNYGFVVLGKRFKSTLLYVMGWIAIAFAILGLLFGVSANIVGLTGLAGAQGDFEGIEGFEDFEGIEGFEDTFATLALFAVGAFILIWVVMSVIFGAYSILFGIGLLKIKDKVPYAHVSGVLNIVAGATYIILIGWVIIFVAYIFEMVMFFKASKKYEGRGRKK